MIYYFKEGDTLYKAKIENLDYQYGYKYIIKAEDMQMQDTPIVFLKLEKVLDKSLAKEPFSLSYKLKDFKARHIRDDEYKICDKLDVKILDDDMKTKFENIIKNNNQDDKKLTLHFKFNSDFIQLDKIVFND